MVRITNQLVTSRAKTWRGVNECSSITVHETGNTGRGADAQAHANLQSGGNVRSASWHIQVDDTEAIRSFPDDVQCWHAGPDARHSIAVEVCVNADGDYTRARANAADVVRQLRAKHDLPASAVRQHHAWTGKNCPARLRRSGWAAFVKSTDPAREEQPVSKMVSPMRGYRTYGFDPTRFGRSYSGHGGLDVGCDAETGRPVYAAFAGTVKKAVSWSTSSNRKSTWAPYRTGNGVLVANPDGEGQGYNHIDPVVKVGQKVKAGQLLGHTDRSGNQTGPHLHFECWADWRNSRTAFDPEKLFHKYGVKVGEAPRVASAPSSGGKGTSSGSHAQRVYGKGDVARLQGWLNAAGYDAGPEDDDYGKRTADAVGAYQEGQLYPKLKADKDWGSVTAQHFRWTRELQHALNEFEGHRHGRLTLRVDGDYRQRTAQSTLDVKQGNERFKVENGKADAGFCRFLGIRKHP